MAKRSSNSRRSKGEQRLDNHRHLGVIERDAVKGPKYSSVFTERPHYGIPEPVKEAP
ncbi:MAG: hypothetical protein K0S76_1886 [Herbinix sp.]|jgi:hypothetical protein|nr:hypothetical protein [Herbinix sp.]